MECHLEVRFTIHVRDLHVCGRTVRELSYTEPSQQRHYSAETLRERGAHRGVDKGSCTPYCWISVVSVGLRKEDRCYYRQKTGHSSLRRHEEVSVNA